jgi:ubiquinone/menaquinone biosynthesis C-methylase UbiE
LSLESALVTIDPPPGRALDLGTGTGAAALAIARRWPETEVVGVDIARHMVEEARRKLPPELGSRVGFDVADAAHLPFPDASFDLVALANMIPFFNELARVVVPGGTVVFGFSGGPETPIYVPAERLRGELQRRGFAHFAEFSAGRGTALLARKGNRP